MYVCNTPIQVYIRHTVWLEIKDYDSFSLFFFFLSISYTLFDFDLHFKWFTRDSLEKFSIYIQELYKSYSYSFSISFFVFLLHTKHEKLNEETNGERFCKEFLHSLLIFLCLKKNILKKIPKIMQIHMYIYPLCARVCVCVRVCVYVWQRRCQKTCGILAQGGAAQQQTF